MLVDYGWNPIEKSSLHIQYGLRLRLSSHGSHLAVSDILYDIVSSEPWVVVQYVTNTDGTVGELHVILVAARTRTETERQKEKLKITLFMS